MSTPYYGSLLPGLTLTDLWGVVDALEGLKGIGVPAGNGYFDSATRKSARSTGQWTALLS